MNVIQIWLFDLRHECVLGLEYYHTPSFQNKILITGQTLCEISHSLPPNTHPEKKYSHNNDFADCSPNNNQICPHWQMRFGIFFRHSFYRFELRFSSVYQMKHIFLLIVQMYIGCMKMLLWYIVILYESLHFHLLRTID